MKFSQFCDIAENTEQEQQLLQMLKKDDMKEFKKIMAKMRRIPVIGKLFAAILALSKSENIAEFRQTEHYPNIKNWDFKVDFDKGSLSINPSDIQKKKMINVLAVICVVITVLLICRKLCCRKK